VLLASALELFRRHGFQATSLAMLTEHSGVPAAPMMYRHFGDKDGLIVAATDTWEADFRAHLQQHLQAQDGPRARLLAILDFLGSWLTEHDWRGWLVADAAVELAEDTAHGVHQVVARHRQAIRALLADLAAAAGACDPAAWPRSQEGPPLAASGALSQAFPPASSTRSSGSAGTLVSLQATDEPSATQQQCRTSVRLLTRSAHLRVLAPTGVPARCALPR
jgi:AcrR family transcriptional regulator